VALNTIKQTCIIENSIGGVLARHACLQCSTLITRDILPKNLKKCFGGLKNV
jgi:hypothetical protein